MQRPEFSQFRLVGGTALSLQLGHRLSVDIDLFTDASYGTIDFNAIESFFNSTYPYVFRRKGFMDIGVVFYVGNSELDSVKVDMFYEEPFVYPMIELDNIRLASKEEINAMKLEVISRKGRKKDFWDLHELTNHYDVQKMIGFHEQKYPYGHDENLIRAKLTDFSSADDELDPQCLHGKYWELIKHELQEWGKIPYSIK